jgi:hypothetical protein
MTKENGIQAGRYRIKGRSITPKQEKVLYDLTQYKERKW